jgi:hypothetical protein
MQKNVNKIGLLYDFKDRMVFRDIRKVYYEITESNLKKYEFFYNRYLFSFTLVLLVSILNIYAALGVGLVSFVILELFFRKGFLSDCSRIENFVPHKDKNTLSKTKIQLIVLGLIYLLLGAILFIITFNNDNSEQVTYISYGITLFALFTGIKSLFKSFKQST